MISIPWSKQKYVYEPNICLWLDDEMNHVCSIYERTALMWDSDTVALYPQAIRHQHSNYYLVNQVTKDFGLGIHIAAHRTTSMPVVRVWEYSRHVCALSITEHLHSLSDSKPLVIDRKEWFAKTADQIHNNCSSCVLEILANVGQPHLQTVLNSAKGEE